MHLLRKDGEFKTSLSSAFEEGSSRECSREQQNLTLRIDRLELDAELDPVQ